jgi:hypothetical protein
VSLSRVREENVLAPYVVIAHGFKYYVRRFPKRGIFAVDKIWLVFWPETTLSLKLRVFNVIYAGNACRKMGYAA